jgi:hypothetical protein
MVDEIIHVPDPAGAQNNVGCDIHITYSCDSAPYVIKTIPTGHFKTGRLGFTEEWEFETLVAKPPTKARCHIEGCASAIQWKVSLQVKCYMVIHVSLVGFVSALILGIEDGVRKDCGSDPIVTTTKCICCTQSELPPK